MTIFQIFATLFALFMLFIVNVHHRKAKLSPLEASFWYSTWLLFIIICLFPDLLMGIADLFHFARVFDLLVVVALMILSLLVITSYFNQKEISSELEMIIRQQAFDDIDKKIKKHVKK